MFDFTVVEVSYATMTHRRNRSTTVMMDVKRLIGVANFSFSGISLYFLPPALFMQFMVELHTVFQFLLQKFLE